MKYGEKIIFKTIRIKVPWEKEEDLAIQQLVTLYGIKKWAIIAKEINLKFGFPKRTGKQCRERWTNHLNPKIEKKSWSKFEDTVLMEKYLLFGKKWAEIAEYLPGRTAHSVKNRFYSELRKKIRNLKRNLLKNLKPSQTKEREIILQYKFNEVCNWIIKKQINFHLLNEEKFLNFVLSVHKKVNLESATNELKKEIISKKINSFSEIKDNTEEDYKKNLNLYYMNFYYEQLNSSYLLSQGINFFNYYNAFFPSLSCGYNICGEEYFPKNL